MYSPCAAATPRFNFSERLKEEAECDIRLTREMVSNANLSRWLNAVVNHDVFPVRKTALLFEAVQAIHDKIY